MLTLVKLSDTEEYRGALWGIEGYGAGGAMSLETPNLQADKYPVEGGTVQSINISQKYKDITKASQLMGIP